LIPVAITGSRGYVGARLVAEFSKRGVPVIEIDISAPNRIDLCSESAAADLSALLPASFDLIHLAFPLPGTMGRQRMTEVVDRMNNSLLKMERSPRKSLLISSTAVYSPNNLMSFSPWEVYGWLKSKTEDLLQNLGSVSILRPGTLIDASRRSAIATIYRRALMGRLSILPEGGSLSHPFLHVDDLVNACCTWQEAVELTLKTTDLWATDPISPLAHLESRGVPSRILNLPKLLQHSIGSDAFPIAGIAKWHLRALSYDVTARNSTYWGATPPQRMQTLLDGLLL